MLDETDWDLFNLLIIQAKEENVGGKGTNRGAEEDEKSARNIKAEKSIVERLIREYLK